MPVHVAGAGAAGTAVARALHLAGWTLGEIACRTVERATERCALIGAGRPVDLDRLAAPRPETGTEPAVLVVAVPDRHITATARSLAARPWPDGSVALHLSGSEEVAALAPLAEAGLSTGGLHPLKSFVDPRRDAESLAGTVFALEGAEAALEVGQQMAADLGARPVRLAPGGRAAWHAAAAHACNHLVALLDQALDLMELAGLDRDTARAALLPLLAGTVENLGEHPPGRALTGPVVRGDAGAVARHVAAMDSLPPDVVAAYRALARRALALARDQRGLDDELAARIEAALRGDTE